MNTRCNHLAIIRQHSRPLEPLPTGESAVAHPLRNIDAVLLDVYGTLFISASGDFGAGESDEAQSEAFCQALAAVGLSCACGGAAGVACLHETIRAHHARARRAGIEHPEVEIIEVWREALDGLNKRGEISGPLGEADLCALSLQYELLTNPVWPMPGAAEALTELANRGLRLGLVSNGQWFTPLLFPALLGGELDALGIGPELQFWSCRAGRAKPDEFLFRQAAEAFHRQGIAPERVLHVGNDLLNDVLPAASVGFRTALFAGDRRSLRRRAGDPRVAGLVPDVVLLHLRDLLSCVRSVPEA